MKKLLLGILFVCFSVSSFADAVQLKSGHPDSYTVKKGDTLWDISNVFLNDPWQWTAIWHINPQIENPHLIYPGDTLALVEVNGETKLTVDERGPVKLLAETRTTPINDAIPPIPLEHINAFLSKTRIINSTKEFDSAPYVLAGEDKRIISGAGDQIYARGKLVKDDSVFGIYRLGDAYQDPDTKEVLGIQARDIASVRLLDLDGDVGTFVVNRSAEEIRISDRLLRSENTNLASSFIPKPPKQKIQGQIIGVDSGVRNIGNMSVVMINRGKREGLEAGDVLEVGKRGETVRDKVKNEVIELPDRKAGLIMIFRTFDKMSLGLVLKTKLALAIGDRVRNPE